jgi:hypothetical protein
LAVFFAAGCVALMATRASAQGAYKSIPMNKKLLDENGQVDEALIKRVQSETKSYVTSGKGNPNMANGYYAAYVPTMMTAPAPEGIKNINTFVGEANTYLARAHRSNRPQVAANLTGYVFYGMKRVAVGDHHPSARIAATLLLSRLDYKPANNQNRTPPIPYLPSFPVLRDLYEDANNTDGLRAAALQGLHRHSRYAFTPRDGFRAIPADAKTALIAQMRTLLESDPPKGRSPEVHAYLQRFAIDIIDVLRPIDDAQLGVKLVSISMEPSKPDLIALYSASRIGSMSKELKGKVAQPEKVLESWTRRALDAFEAELSRLAALDRATATQDQPRKPEDFLQKPAAKKRSRSMMGGMDEMEDMEDYGDMDEMDMMGEMDMMDDMDDMDGMMGMGMMGGRITPDAKPQPPEVRASRRKLNHVLQQLHRGVAGVAAIGVPSANATTGGLLASVDAAKKPVVEAWLTEMEPIVVALNDSLLDDREKFVEGLQVQADLLRELVGEEEVAGLPDELAAIAEEVAPAAPVAADVAAPAAAAPATVDDPLAPQPVDVVSP